jgi:hypothetical protein
VEPSPVPSPATATLTVASPSARLPLSLARAVDHIELRVVGVSNPNLQGFSLRASIRGIQDGRTATVVLGTVSPFPPDQPGTFALPISGDAARLLEATNGHIDVLVDLLPVDPARPLEPPLEVVVSAASPSG